MERLTAIEIRTIQDMLSKGLWTEREQADYYGLQTHQIKNRWRSIRRKLGAVTKTEATVYAIRDGIVKVN